MTGVSPHPPIHSQRNRAAWSTSARASRTTSRSPPARSASSNSDRADWSRAIAADLFDVNPGRNTPSFTRWPLACYPAEREPALRPHRDLGRLPHPTIADGSQLETAAHPTAPGHGGPPVGTHRGDLGVRRRVESRRALLTPVPSTAPCRTTSAPEQELPAGSVVSARPTACARNPSSVGSLYIRMNASGQTSFLGVTLRRLQGGDLAGRGITRWSGSGWHLRADHERLARGWTDGGFRLQPGSIRRVWTTCRSWRASS